MIALLASSFQGEFGQYFSPLHDSVQGPEPIIIDGIKGPL